MIFNVIMGGFKHQSDVRFSFFSTECEPRIQMLMDFAVLLEREFWVPPVRKV